MTLVKKTIRFTIEENGQMQTGITQEVTLEWQRYQYVCYCWYDGYYCKGVGPSQTTAILDWLAYRIGAK